MAAQSDSVYIRAGCGHGVTDAIDSPGRGANKGSIIVVSTNEHHEAAVLHISVILEDGKKRSG